MKSGVIGAFSAAVMPFGIIPTIPIFANNKNILPKTQKSENMKYD